MLKNDTKMLKSLRKKRVIRRLREACRVEVQQQWLDLLIPEQVQEDEHDREMYQPWYNDEIYDDDRFHDDLDAYFDHHFDDYDDDYDLYHGYDRRPIEDPVDSCYDDDYWADRFDRVA